MAGLDFTSSSLELSLLDDELSAFDVAAGDFLAGGFCAGAADVRFASSSSEELESLLEVSAVLFPGDLAGVVFTASLGVVFFVDSSSLESLLELLLSAFFAAALGLGVVLEVLTVFFLLSSSEELLELDDESAFLATALGLEFATGVVFWDEGSFWGAVSSSELESLLLELSAFFFAGVILATALFVWEGFFFSSSELESLLLELLSSFFFATGGFVAVCCCFFAAGFSSSSEELEELELLSAFLAGDLVAGDLAAGVAEGLDVVFFVSSLSELESLLELLLAGFLAGGVLACGVAAGLVGFVSLAAAPGDLATGFLLSSSLSESELLELLSFLAAGVLF